LTRSDAAQLGEVLADLKTRSGRSYEWIGKRANLSKSAAHRVCTGQSVPPEFGTVERIARLCDATDEDIARLFRLWQSATAARTTDSIPVVPGPVSVLLPPEQPVAFQRLRSVTKTAVSAGLVVILLIVLGASTSPRASLPSPAAAAPQQISGPTWTLPPAPVPHELFGVTLNSSTGQMPSFDVGALRLWDSGTRWASIETARGQFSWTVLDRLVSGATAAELPVLFVLGGTPVWANPGAPAAPYPDGSRAAPPQDLADWDAYVTALVTRYHGRISGYELWALANDPRYFNGSISVLVEMTRRANAVIKRVDPAATVVCPGMGNLWTAAGQQVLRQFAEAGGYNYCDVAGIKLYQRTASDPPETMLELATTIDRLLHESGVQPRLWSTGTTYTITLQHPLSAEQARSYAVRFFLVGIYARYLNLERMYFYSWGSSTIPIVLQVPGGTPTPAALAVEQLQHWLAHAQSVSCGHGLPSRLPANVWQCDFRIDGHAATIRWTDSGTATTTAEPSVTDVRHLDGALTPVRAGDTIAVGPDPILIERR